MNIKEKADSFCSYDLDICRKRKSRRREVRHQKECIESLKSWYENTVSPRGTIVALPTGSGKTFTSIRFLCEYPLSQGYKILWLAHTHHLLEQAYYQFGPGKMTSDEKYEVGNISDPAEKLNVRLVSGSDLHQDMSDVKPDDDVIISTLQTISMAYKKEHPDLEKFLESTDGKLIVVFDEAHHSPAPSYRKLLIGDDSDQVRDSLRERFPDMYILGLTATPTYTDIKKRGWLRDIFPQEIIYQAEIKKLILERILSKPDIRELKTLFNPSIDNQEYQLLINRYGRDIPDKIIKRLAMNRERNQLIADSYDKNKYGKTIIFTDYIDQCEQLNEFLQNRNKNLQDKIRSDVMYTRSDGDRNAEVLEKFRNGDLDVVINIRMLTEGTDVPDVDTVFLTRQTTSDILLTQMVGRALRGPVFGGTETANLVFFIDDWKKAINWSKWDPKTWTVHKKHEIKIGDTLPVDYIPIRLIQDLVKKLGNGGKNNAEFSTYLPVGWYRVHFYGRDFSENDSPEVQKIQDFVLVFEKEVNSYEKFIEDLKTMDIEEFDDDQVLYENCEERLQEWAEQYFDADDYMGNDLLKNLFLIACHVAQNKEESPQFFEFEERDAYDMDDLAQKYMNCNRMEEDSHLRSIYEDGDLLWSTLYPEYDQFKAQYNACVEYLLSQGTVTGSGDAPVDPPEDREKVLFEKLKTGRSVDKIQALQELAGMGEKEHLHEATIELIHDLTKDRTDKNVMNAAIDAFKVIIRPLFPEEREYILKRDAYTCLCCGEDSRHNLQVDHIIPRNLGGNNDEDNLQTLCKYCNGQKGTIVMDFRRNKTDLSEKPDKSPFTKKFEYMSPQDVENLDLWRKIIKRNINFFYECGAVRDVKISESGYNKNLWEISLYRDNPDKWLEDYVRQINNEISDIFKKYKLISPRISFTQSRNRSNDIPSDYEKLWNKYCKHPRRLDEEEKDRLARYINEHGFLEN